MSSRKHLGTKKYPQKNGGLKVVSNYGGKRGGGGGGGSGCFPGDCQIATPTGTRAISELAVGDAVLSYDAKTGQTNARLVTAVFNYADRPLLEVCLGSAGRVLKVSPHHSLLTARGWLRVDQLRPRDLLLTAAGNMREILAINPLRRTTVFNLHTSGEHTFIADGVVAHNFTFLRDVRVWLHRWFFDAPRLRARVSGNHAIAGVVQFNHQPNGGEL